MNPQKSAAIMRTAAALRMAASTVETVVNEYDKHLNGPSISCPECGRTYKTTGSLSSHVKAKHG